MVDNFKDNNLTISLSWQHFYLGFSHSKHMISLPELVHDKTYNPVKTQISLQIRTVW